MIRRIASISNSIVVHVLTVVLIAGGASLLALAALLQTPVGGRFFDRALAENSDSIAELVWLVEHSPMEIEAFVLSAYSSTSRIARIDDNFQPLLVPNPGKSQMVTSGKSEVVSALRERDIRFRTIGVFEMRPFVAKEGAPAINAVSLQHLAIRLDDGRVLNIWLAPTISLTARPNFIVVALGVLIILVIFLSVALRLVITRPIRELEKNAEQVGLSDTSIPVAVEGPRELRRLSGALNRMRLRLARLIHEREQLIVAIAHDIATGLTRLRLRMDEKPEIADAGINSELEHMERLVTEMMAYARAEDPLVEPELIELSALMRSIANAAPCQVGVIEEPGFGFTMAGSPMALTRVFENLIENARRYGGGEIIVRLSQSSSGAEISIEDNGEGMPEDEFERVFEPFYRRETSRNRATGGTGLGLGIARAIAQTHGASLTLARSEAGGLAARVFFPVELAT